MRRSSKVIDRLDEMLDAAIEGSFVEDRYDETQLSRFESRFRQYLSARETAQKRIGEERSAIKSLVTDISHQTKTPLANILLYAQLLEEQCRDEALAPYIRQICMQAEKLQFLIQSLVKLSRLESGMVETNPQKMLVAPLVEEAVRLLAGQADEKQIRLEVSPLPEAEAIYDMRWTAEALGNLLDNAVKYSPCKSTVTVSVRVFELFVCVSVRDEGPGIPEEEQAQIFARFYRGKNAEGREGSGIGLYLARMVLEKEQGYIRVISGGEKGSCFQMFLRRA